MFKEFLTFKLSDCRFYIKNKLKSEIFKDKKDYKKMFFSVITKNLNWEISNKNLVTWKRWDGVRDEKLHTVIQLLQI